MSDGPTSPDAPASADVARLAGHPAGHPAGLDDPSRSGGPGTDPTGADPGAALAEALRELIGVAVTTDAPADLLRAAADAVEAVTGRLRAHVPAGPRVHLLADAASMADAMPFDLVIGRRNPLAVPLTVHMGERPDPTASGPPGGGEGDRPAGEDGASPDGPEAFTATAVAEGTFPIAYQGAPGWVHGGAIAAAFDIVLTAANIADGPAGPTVDLRVQYRRPTAVGVPLRFEAAVEHRTPRRVVSRARLVQQGTVTATATGTFALRDPADIDAGSRPRR